MQQHDGAADSPIDFGPHLWRRVRALLTEYEFRARAGAGFESGPRSILEHLTHGLVEFEEAVRGSRGTNATVLHRDSDLHRLAKCWEQYRSSPYRKAWMEKARPPLGGGTGNQNDWEAVKQSVRRAADAAYASVHYVQFTRRSGQETGVDASQVRRLLHQIVEFQKRLKTSVGTIANTQGGSEITSVILQRLKEQADEIAQTEKLLRDDLQASLHRALEAQGPNAGSLCDQLLATPLLKAGERRLLLTKIAAITAAADAGRRDGERGTEFATASRGVTGVNSLLFSQDDRAWVKAQLESELALSKVFGYYGDVLETQIQDLIRSMENHPRTDRATEDKFWADLNERGAQAFRAGVEARRRICNEAADTKAKQPPPGAFYLTATRMDPRDVRPGSEEFDVREFLALPLRPASPPDTIRETTVAFQGDALNRSPQGDGYVLRLTDRNPHRLTVTVESQLGDDDEQLIWTLGAFDNDRLQIRRASGAVKPLAEKRPFHAHRASEGRAVVDLEIQALVDATDDSSYEPLTITIARADPKKPPRCEIPLRIFPPRTQQVELQVEINGSQSWPLARRKSLESQGGGASQESGLVLDAFPNDRKTSYQFFLNSQATKEMKLDVQLFRIPSIANRWAPGHLFHEDKVLPEVRHEVLGDSGHPRLASLGPALAQTAKMAPIVLPSGARKRVVFEAPSGESKAAVGGKPGAANGEEWNGLVCFVTSIDPPQQRWIYWIELRTLPPEEYVNVQLPGVTPKPGAEKHEVKIQVALRTDETGRKSIPGLADDRPVSVHWPVIFPDLDVVDGNRAGQLTSASGRTQLNDRVVIRDDSLLVRLNVDGAPRSMLRRLWRNGEGAEIPPIGVPRLRIRRIEQTRSDGEKWVYFPGRDGDLGEEHRVKDPEKKETRIYLAAKQPLMLKTQSNNADTRLRAFLEVDAIKDAFTPANRLDEVVLSLRDRDLSADSPLFEDRLHQDRVRKWRLAGVVEHEVTVQHSVDDLVREIGNLAGRTNARCVLSAELSLPEWQSQSAAGATDMKDEVDILLDGAAPTIDPNGTNFNKIISKADVLTLTFHAADRGKGATGLDPRKTKVSLWPGNSRPDEREATEKHPLPVYASVKYRAARSGDRTEATAFSATLELPTAEGITPGPHWVKLEVADRVDHVATQYHKLTIEPTPEKPIEKKGEPEGINFKLIQAKEKEAKEAKKKSPAPP